MTSLPNGVTFAGRDGTTMYSVPCESVEVPPSDVGLASRAGWTQTEVAPWQVKENNDEHLVGQSDQAAPGTG